MPTSDEELEKMKKDVADLREKVTAEQEKEVLLAQEVENDVTYNALQAEKESLEASLAAYKARNTKTAAKQGAAAVLDPQGTADKIEEAKQEGLLVDSAKVTKEKEGSN